MTINGEKAKVQLTAFDNSQTKIYFTVIYEGNQCNLEIDYDVEPNFSICEEAYNSYRKSGSDYGFYWQEWYRTPSKKKFDECVKDIAVPEELLNNLIF